MRSSNISKLIAIAGLSMMASGIAEVPVYKSVYEKPLPNEKDAMDAILKAQAKRNRRAEKRLRAAKESKT